jgi:hypothetical protein
MGGQSSDMNLAELAEQIEETVAANLQGMFRYAPDDEAKLAECERVLADAKALQVAARKMVDALTAKRNEEAEWVATVKQIKSMDR